MMLNIVDFVYPWTMMPYLCTIMALLYINHGYKSVQAESGRIAKISLMGCHLQPSCHNES
jgi:hypothetical protein